MLALHNHVPSWAKRQNLLSAIPAEQPMEPMALVLARHADREQAFEKLLADQQDPSSPEFHHWLTPSQIGERFGLSKAEIDELTGWLESQGLQVNWVAPARDFIGFSGSAGDVGRAFQNEFNYYDDGGKRKIAAASAPLVPAEYVPLVKAIHGLYTIENRPMSWVHPEESNSPDFTTNNGEHFIQAQDFDVIYEVNPGFAGRGVKIGIVGRSRVSLADLSNYTGWGGGYLPNPIVIVPTKFGGVDPGAPRT